MQLLSRSRSKMNDVQDGRLSINLMKTIDQEDCLVFRFNQLHVF